MIYNGLSDIADKFDTFLFDAYGVFWEGNDFYLNSREVMAELIKKGKTVVVISNSSSLGADVAQRYAQRGLLEKTHYNLLITSGDLLRHHLLAGDISFASCEHPQKYYVIGQPHHKAFANTKYIAVDCPQKADFVYCSVPYMYKKDVAAYPQYKAQYWPVKLDESGEVCCWDTLTEAPFVEIVEKIVRLKLPILNANPDFIAKEGHPLVPESEAVFVVRNGMLAEMFRQRGAEVLEYGKPHKNIYEFTFAKLSQQGINPDKTTTCMIGDTVRTDIKGAINAEIAPILCVKTGVTAEEILKGNTLENLCQPENIMLQQVILINSVGGK